MTFVPISVMDLTTQLEAQEAIIERGFSTFVEVGQAIAAIRDGRLYLGAFSTFEDYCKQRWGWTRRYVNYQIAAASVVKAIGGPAGANAHRDTLMGTIVPSSESQVRPLVGLEPEQQRAVWAQVIKEAEARSITAKVVAEVRQAIVPLKQKKARRGPPNLAGRISRWRGELDTLGEQIEPDDALDWLAPEDRHALERHAERAYEFWGKLCERLSRPRVVRVADGRQADGEDL